MHISIGFTQYGKSDIRSDGSYVTIEWFHICRLPVYPFVGLELGRSTDVS